MALPSDEPDAVISNLPDHRITRAVREVSRADLLKARNVVIGKNSCGLCTDGQTIYADPAFVDFLSDEELSAAMAHEMAHMDLGHVGRAGGAGILVNVLFAVLGGRNPGIGTQLGQKVASSFVVAQYSQKQEIDADTQAAFYLSMLGYNGPSAVRGMLSKYQSKGVNNQTSWFSSHPSIPQRIAHLQNLANTYRFLASEEEMGRIRKEAKQLQEASRKRLP